MSKLRLLYSSNSIFCTSGYGVQGKSLIPRLAGLPEFGGIQNIAQFAWYGMQGGVANIDGLRIYPAGMDPYGNDVIEAHTKNFNANIVISLIDVWVMKDTARKVAPALWLPWTPIDHDPVPKSVISSLQGAHLTLSYSKWGKMMLDKIGIRNEYIPHGIETDIYRVFEDRQRVNDFRQQVFRLGKDGHLSVMVAANKGYPDRKGFQQQLRAWAEFAKDKPNARIYIHTEPTQMYGGLELGELIANLGIAEKVLFPERYQYFIGMPAEYLALIYNSADVLLANSMSEGFGIPLIEAQACGTPVITTNFSAMPELVRWGYKIDPLDMLWTPMNAWQAWPDHNGITEALNELYAQWEASGGQWSIAKRLQTQTAIHQEYSWDSIVRDNWQPLITRLANEAPPLAQAQQAQPQAEVKQVATQHKAKRVQPVQPGEITVNGLQPEAVA